MSDSDHTYECLHCGRSIPDGHGCNCRKARQESRSKGDPDAVVLCEGSGDKYDVEIVEDEQE